MFDNKWQKKEMPLVSLIGMGGGIASPAFLASIVLNILKPTVFSPVDDSGVPDFDYTAESSAITNASVVEDVNYTDTLSGTTLSSTDLDNMFKSTLEYVNLNLNETLTFTNNTGRTVYVAFRHLHNSPNDPNTRVETYKYRDGSLTGSTYTSHSSVWPNHPDGWNTSTFSCPAGSTIGLKPISMPTNGRVSIDGFYFDDTDEKLVNISGSTTLTLTDTTVSKVSDGSLVGGSTIDQVLTVGETVQADTAISSTVNAPVFSTTLYTGDGALSKVINTGIDNTGKSLLWFKNRDFAQWNTLVDTIRGDTSALYSNESSAEDTASKRVNDFLSDGVNITSNATVNEPGDGHVVWNFRAAPGFFDVLSWSGNSVNGRQISHDLGSAPGAIIIKNLTNTANWEFWHNSFDADDYMGFNSTTPKYETSGPWNNTLPTSEHFTVSSDMDVNRTGDNYVAYLFADTPGLIKCGSYTGAGDGTTVDCGFKPGWVLIKQATGTNNAWRIYDNKRGNGTHQCEIYPNYAYPEDCGLNPVNFTNTGFTLGYGNNTNNETYIYIAIAENPNIDVTTSTTASGTVSASSGNTITLSNTTGTWSTGMKVQGTDSDTKDNPGPIKVEDVSLTSSAPTAERNVNTWGDAVWEIATDENFTQNVQTATTALSATGTQAGPSFTLEKDTGYYTRTKYTALGQESEWSNVTYFVTASSVYVDDVFSTYLYTGNADTSGSQTINNGIDLAGEGGFVWIKRRTAGSHTIYDTERGATQALNITTDAGTARPGGLTSFNSDGFTVGNYTDENAEGQNVVSWTFRKAPGFLDIVTWDGDGTSGRAIPHGLGSTPGMVIIKCTTDTKHWPVWHRSLPNVSADYFLQLNTTDPENNPYQGFRGAPDSSNFYVGANSAANGPGRSYVAYVFAHDDQSFGSNGDESIIKCGSYTGTTSAIDLNLGFEPQWVMIKRATGAGQNFTNWGIFDNMRGVQPGQDALLAANLDHEENGTYLYANEDLIEFTSSGITIDPTGVQNTVVNSHGETYIYMAIRRPHKPATVVSDIFDIVTAGGAGTPPPQFTTDFPVDLVLRKGMNDAGSPMFASRLQGTSTVSTAIAGTESQGATALRWDYQNGWSSVNETDPNLYAYMFKRSPGFMDVVTYKGTGGVMTINHNLEAVPELMIVKSRTSGIAWYVYDAINGATNYLILNTPDQSQSSSYFWNNTDPTSTQFTVGSGAALTGNDDYVAYLFATQPGISKVGSYVGNGPNGAQQVDCGFTNGAAFILVKNASSSGDWYLLDSERGINAYNETEPYITLNNAATQQTANILGYHNVGFMVSGQYGTASLNNAGETYIFLAIANP